MKFWQVDSFTKEIFRGNPAGVFVLSDELGDSQLKLLAREMNLSETAFVIKDGSSWHLRWFTPNAEVDLCGHATLATAHVLWEQGLETGSEICFNTRSGKLHAARSGIEISLDFPQQPAHPVQLGLDLETLLPHGDAGFVGSNGHDFVAVLNSAQAVANFAPDMGAISALRERGFLVTAPASEAGYDYVYRAFFPKLNIPEDPVTGSANTALAPLWAERLGKTRLRARQLSERGGELEVCVEGDRVKISGSAVTVFEGVMRSF